MTFHSFFFLFFISLSLFYPQRGFCWSDTVVSVLEGDLIKVGYKGRMERVRLYGIDSPAPGQTFAEKAKQYTAAMVEGKRAKIRPVSKDRQGHVIAMVWVNGHLLNQVLIREGYARVDRGNCRQAICEDWIRYEVWARDRGRGLWGASQAVPR